MRPETLIAYCTGMIVVCTILMTFVATMTMRNFRLLNEIYRSAPGAHDRTEARDVATSSRRHVPSPEHVSVERFDSGVANQSYVAADEWTGPVTTYTPAGREG